MDIVIRVAGEAGQGVVSAGDMLVNIFSESNLYIFTNRSYMSRIRGGLNWYDIRISDKKTYSPTEKSDILVALSEASLKVLKKLNKKGGAIFYNSNASSKSKNNCHYLDFAKEAGNSRTINSYAFGLCAALFNLPEKLISARIRKEFKDKGKELIRQNLEAVKKGYEYSSNHPCSIKYELPKKKTPDFIISGAKAIALSAACSGLKFAVAYPMTPATATFTTLAAFSDKYKIVVEQAEDEIAAINMVNGASYAGVPAMTMTSGGGFALMCEGVSLAGITENPVFIMIAQRPGPATGLPTRTGQEDLGFALHAGHGEFPRAIFAPGTIEQCYKLTRKALETAHKYQTPVIMLTDQYLQDHVENIKPLNCKYDPIDRCIEKRPAKDYKRYAKAANGISPRALPGSKAIVICDSDEHSEEGHLVEDFEIRIEQQNKRMRKLKGLTREALTPEFYGHSKAKNLIICWGSTYGACREAIDILNKNKTKYAMLHFSQLWPLNHAKISKYLIQSLNLFFIEGNFTGQFASIMKAEGIVNNYNLISRYDGMPISSEYIIKELEKYEN